MAIIRNVNTGVINEVTEDVAEYYLKHERDDYERVASVDATPAPDAPDGTGSGQEVENMKYSELQALAKLLNLPATGNKDDLVAAIKEAQNA